ncbi:MAG: ArsS family sensor histidine kinase [Campylobacterota bacterium]
MGQSIFFRITLFFVVVMLGAGVGFYALSVQLRKEHESRLRTEAQAMLGILRQSVVYPHARRMTFLREKGYRVLAPEPALMQSLEPAFSGVPDDYPVEIRDSMREGIIRVLKDADHLYIHLVRASPPMVVAKPEAARRSLWPDVVFATVLGALLILYLAIVRTLFPLTRLIRSIRTYGVSGRYEPIASKSRDELGLISTALDTAMRKNRSLIEARQLFLRNIMHELKTPITVGKLALPFLKKGEEKSILERAFVRMEQLIQEVVRVEQITSGELKPDLRSCDPSLIGEKACALLFLREEQRVETRFDGNLITADCDAFVSVFKNLIDNALKYSPDHAVRIEQEGDTLIFSNAGDAWEPNRTLASLSEPFFHSRSHPESFGLGLYIVKSILDAHGFEMVHRYQDGRHRFEVTCHRPQTSG